ncbi:MAG: GNAT family N-acetyltransferase [Oscillospiraceae bacterium]|nr:GNAT family N-acetyltransferase [Oscillospiraceae bacterium]
MLKPVSASELAAILKNNLDFALEAYVLAENALCKRPVYEFMEAYSDSRENSGKNPEFGMAYREAGNPEETYVSINSKNPDKFGDLVCRQRPCEIICHGDRGTGEFRQSFYRVGGPKIQNGAGLKFAPMSKSERNRRKTFDGEPHCYLNALFRSFVQEKIYGDCAIIGAYGKEGGLSGYLAYYAIAENIRDVSYIYVGEKHRGKGCGKALLNFFADKNANEGKISYYSFADGEISENLAKSCGFAPCAFRRVYTPSQCAVF